MADVYKIDLHTHSTASPDGGITAEQYAQLLQSGALDYIAVTDHDHIDFALILNKQLGERIIVGQEITTTQGELIGLYLEKLVQPGQDAAATAKAIAAQGGLVYVPHPFETVRSGVDRSVVDSIADLVDIVEIHNGRAVFQNKGPQAAAWARLHGKPGAASSDAHGQRGVGTTYSTVSEAPTKKNLAKLLATARHSVSRPPLHTLLYPKFNRLRATLRKSKT